MIDPRKPYILNSTAAHYNHFTQTVHLKKVTMAEMLNFQAALRDAGNQGFELIRGVTHLLRPMVHELRHWVDMNCSIRGVKALSHIFNLVKDPVPSNPSIDQIKRDISLGFFIMRAPGKIPQPWRHGISLSKPLHAENIEHFSVCFFAGDDIHGKKHLFKSPIYLGSMLECCAYYQELRDATPQMTQAGTWFLDKHIFAKDEVKFAYDSDLAEYHSLAHAFAGAVREPDMVATYEFSSALCFWLFNMPNDLLAKSVTEALEWNHAAFGNNHLAGYVEHWPHEVLIMTALNKLRSMPESVRGSLREGLVYELFDCWKDAKDSYFERSHEGFVEEITKTDLVAPEYFHTAKSALIENNKAILERKTLIPSVLRLKYPTLYCGDFNVKCDPAFDGQEAYYSSITERLMAELIEIKH